MNKIIDYKVVSVRSDEGVRDKVNREIDRGWQPLGGLCAHTDKSETEWFYQAMVKYEENNK